MTEFPPSTSPESDSPSDLGELDAELQLAVAALKDGLLVAFPTETVYGLGADATNQAAVARIFAAKGRPTDHPLIVHVIGPADLLRWARDPGPQALTLADHFWPGPLTLIVKRGAGLADAVTGGRDTVGLRAPDHPLAQALLRSVGRPLAAPSANRFGGVSPTTAAHVQSDLGEAVAVILDGGPCRVGLESTIVDVSGGPPRILRPGGVTAEQLQAVLGQPVPLVDSQAGPAAEAPAAPGTLASHYAPRARLLLAEGPAAAAARCREGLERGERVGLLASGAAEPEILRCPWPVSAAARAQRLYAALRELDEQRCDLIVVELDPGDEEAGIGVALRDRLSRAAHPHRPGESAS